jgi:hypothetical protein
MPHVVKQLNWKNQHGIPKHDLCDLGLERFCSKGFSIYIDILHCSWNPTFRGIYLRFLRQEREQLEDLGRVARNWKQVKCNSDKLLPRLFLFFGKGAGIWEHWIQIGCLCSRWPIYWGCAWILLGNLKNKMIVEVCRSCPRIGECAHGNSGETINRQKCSLFSD